MALKYQHNTVVRATVDGVPGVLALRIQETPEYGLWLGHNGKPGPTARFDREVTDIVPLVSLTTVEVNDLIDGLKDGAYAEVLAHLEAALALVEPVVDEPVGLGAVAQDVWGEQYVRIPEVADDALPWRHAKKGHHVGWEDIVEPVIESDGAPVLVEVPVPPTEPTATEPEAVPA